MAVVPAQTAPTGMPNDPLLLSTDRSSAFVGQPPNTTRDYYIVKGLLRMVGMGEANPMTGYFLAARPPPGYQHDSRVVGIQVGLAIAMLAIVLPTAIRVFLRARKKQMRFGWDDWTIIAAAVLALTYPIAQTIGLYMGGAGLHTWEVTYEQYEIALTIGVFCKIIFYQAVSLIKISIALFIRCLASGASRRWKWFCDIFLVTVGLFMLVALFWLIYTCSPVETQWSLYARGVSESPPRCSDTILQTRILSGIHVAQCMVVLSAPVVILWTVRMDRTKKIRLFICWAVGGVTVVGGLLRQVRPLIHRDLTRDYVEVLAWTCLDLALGIVIALLPVMVGMFSNVWHRATSTIGVPSHGIASSNPGFGQRDAAIRLPSCKPPQRHKASESKGEVVVRMDEAEMGIVRTRVVSVQTSSRSSLEGFVFSVYLGEEYPTIASQM